MNDQPLMTPPPTTALTFDEYQRRKWIPGFDGIRAIAALAVLAGHMHTTRWDWLNGNRGVTVFFVLSGYLITMLALKEERARGALNLSAFYVRRSFRIFPIYYFVLALYCVLIFATDLRSGRSSEFLSTLWAYVLYVQEFIILNPETPNPFFSQAWTLGIEEKFYLVWPIVYFLAAAKFKQHRRLLTVAMILLFGIVGLLDQRGIGRYTHHYVFLFLGCLLADLLHYESSYARMRWLGQTRWVYATTALLLVATFGWRMIYSHPDPKSYDTFVYVAYKDVYGVLTFFFLASIILGRTAIHSALSIKPLAFVGTLSYGVYVIHRLAINVSMAVFPFGHDSWAQTTAHLVLASGLSILAAWLMYRLIEKPCMDYGRQISNRILAGQPAREPEFAGGAPATTPS